MIVLQRRFSNVIISDCDVSPTIEAGSGEGGNNLPMIVDTIVFDESQITCKDNYSNPKKNDPCHPLTQNAGRAVVIIEYEQNDNIQSN